MRQLTPRVQVRSGFKDLGRTADGLHQAYLTFALHNTDAENLSMLAKGQHLLRVEVSRNELKSIKALAGKCNLVSLNASGARRSIRATSIQSASLVQHGLVAHDAGCCLQHSSISPPNAALAQRVTFTLIALCRPHRCRLHTAYDRPASHTSIHD